MSDPATSYKERDELRAVTADRVGRLLFWVQWGGTSGMVVMLAAIAAVSMWRGEINSTLVDHGRRIDAAEVARETDRIATDMRIRSVEQLSVRAAERGDYQAESMRSLRQDMTAIRQILEDMRRRPQGGNP